MRKKLSLCMVLVIMTSSIVTGCGKAKNMSQDSAVNNWTEKSVNEEYIESAGPDGGTVSTEEYFTNGTSTAQKSKIAPDSRYNNSLDQTEQWSKTLPNNDSYSAITENTFKKVSKNPLSTFSIDVDTASYANLRKQINYGVIPQADAVRIEEMLNYFTYNYPEPSGDTPFSIHTEIGKCPWNQENYLMNIGIQGKNVDLDTLPKSNLVFLIDVSGSMEEEDKLPLLKNAFSQLVEELGENDRVSIVVYAGETGVVLDGARGNEKEEILGALASLSAGGSTGGAAGIAQAYELAEENFIKKGNNRVILATDGDFNVGPSSEEELEEIITQKRKSGIYLSVIGFGSGNLKDSKMETLADKGNGNYSYIDSPREARKVLVDEMSGTLLTIAKDVKIQLEFNPDSVESYRLIGYENRALADEDFKNDTIDAGELGAGHSVTAIYEVVPAGAASKEEPELKYQTQSKGKTNKEYVDEICEIRLRYKKPDNEKSKEIDKVVSFHNTSVNNKDLSENFCFAAAVAEFGMILRDSEYKGTTDLDSVLELSENGLGEDEGGYRREFRDLVERYAGLQENGWLR